ncbi:restriction endonuclease subunit S [Rhodococcus pyridinivorans]|uniref:restriction endonuclease subunit S n=2 Tax=Rhodococcus TaxID=1827 RepID=UPI001F3BC041|nr:restriction endonuclease subunit S [Rhodococcus pyridinivorans]
MPSIEPAPGFRWVKLSDLARLESGHTPSRSKPEYWGGDVPWIGIRDATGNHGLTISNTLQSITQEGIENSSARLLPAGTVCLSRTASVGFVVRMGVEMATSQDFVNWVCGPELSSRYLMYLLMLEQDSIRRFSYGTTHQTMYYPEAKALHVCIPTRYEQDAIAEVLGALDDKIAANRRLTSGADALANAHFQNAMSGHTVVGTLGELLALEYGKALPATKRIPGEALVYGSGGPAGTHNEHLVSGPAVIVGRKGTVGATYWSHGPAFPIDTTFHVIPAGRVPLEFCYYLLRGLDWTEYNSDSAVPGLNRTQALKRKVVVPNAEDIKVFSERARVLLELQRSAESESAILAATRDTLLPRLMSGEIRVRDVEDVASNVV